MTKIFLPNLSGGEDDNLSLDDWWQIYHGLIDYRANYEGNMPAEEYLRWLGQVLRAKNRIEQLAEVTKRPPP